MNDAKTPRMNADLTTLGAYTIISRIGQGGMGIVYEALDTNLGRKVAIKVLHPHLLRNENLKARFRREARMHAKLMHPNIVTLLSLFEDEAHMALVMELIEGQDLKAYLRTNPKLSLELKLNIALDILTGLESAHQFGMVHRDLKPANVLVSNQGDVKLLDFGLAKPEVGGDDLTQSGATVGSFRYMAPEQILNKPIDARTDLYAFGILLYFMLVGKLPFDATSNGGEFEIMEKQVREPAPIPKEQNPEINAELSDLILKLLEKDKNDRPRDTSSVRTSIQAIIAHLKTSRQTINKASRKTLNKPSPAPSNADVARQWLRLGKNWLRSIAAPIIGNFSRQQIHLFALGLVFIALGTSAIAVLNMAEATAHLSMIKPNPSIQQESLPTPHLASAQPVAATADNKPVMPEKTNPVPTPPTPKPHIKPADKPMVAATPTPAAKVVPKPKVVVEATPRYATDKFTYKIRRTDESEVLPGDRHEFAGGEHLFFPELKEKGFFTTFRKGESEIVFDQEVDLKTIILTQASVGKLSFEHGYIYLDARAKRGPWVRLFAREADDVDVAVRIQDIAKKIKKIKAVRIKFKTVEPITIGPIDLLL